MSKFEPNQIISLQITLIQVKLPLQIFKTMGKSEFRVLIMHCVFMGKILFKQCNGLISVTRTLLRRKKQLIGGMLTLNPVVQTQKMLNAQVAQIQQLTRKTPKNFTTFLAIRKLKLHEIAEELKISEGSVFTICVKTYQWESYFQSWCCVDKKQQRLDDSEHCLQPKAIHSDQRRKHQQERFLPSYFEMGKVICSSITLRKEEPSIANII